jgi:hypothetical protein
MMNFRMEKIILDFQSNPPAGEDLREGGFLKISAAFTGAAGPSPPPASHNRAVAAWQ